MKNLTSKKSWFLLVLLFIAGVIAKSQETNKSGKDLYRSYFGNDSTSLNILLAPCYSADLFFVLSGTIYTNDTITINEKQYYYREPQPLESFSQPGYHYLFPRQDTLFVREERETGRLYRYYRDYFGMGETEKLICDMTLEVGDKFTVLSHNCLQEVRVEVKSIDYNNGRKTIHLYGNIDLIEGLFPENFPLWQEPLSDMYEGEYGSAQEIGLLCEYKDGVQVYGGPDDCFPDIWSVKETDNNQLIIYPNVIKNNDIITIEDPAYIKDVTMTDVFGRTIEINKKVIDNNKWQIHSCGHYNPGIYLMKVEMGDGKEYTEKIIVE